MATLVANTAVDMTDWNFNNIKLGTINQHISTKYTITGAADGLHYEFTGSGLTYDGGNLMTGGIVTGYRVLDSAGNTLLSINGFSMSASAVEAAIQSGDAGGTFESAVFASNNSITGSAQDDLLVGMSNGTETISGGGGNDTIIDFTTGDAELTTGDHLLGGAGDDNVHLGGKWDGNTVDGGEGFDTVFFTGDYPLGFYLSGTLFQNVEQFVLLNGPNYHFQFDDTVIGADETLRIDASNLGGAARIQIDGRGEVDGHFLYLGSSGNDSVRGGEQSDTFWLDKGGKDKAYGDEGADVFLFGATFTTQDRVRGGDGDDTLRLDGNYNLTFADVTIASVEYINVAAGRDYNLTVADDNVEAGERLTIVGFTLGGGDDLVFNGSAETDGMFSMVDGAGNDTLTGGALGDTFVLSKGGHNIINGGGGDDAIQYTSINFNAAEVVNGGAGNDTLALASDYSGGLVLGAGTLVSIEKLQITEGFDYDITFVDGNVASGQTFTVNASTLSAEYSVRFDGSAELDGKFVMLGGAGRDTLLGGAGKDSLTGDRGADFLSGGGGIDTFTYVDASESTGRKYDTIDSFNATNELIDVDVAITGRDADVVGGTLNKGSFDVDLALKADAAHLLANHVVLFKPNAGNLAGHSFLVIDQNGVAGYQTGEDIVIDFTNLIHPGDIGIATFI